jgi:hypothetical protein
MVNQPLIYGAWGLAWPVGFGALFAIIGAASHFGASAKVMGVLFMDAVAGGGGFLAASALTAWRNRT